VLEKLPETKFAVIGDGPEREELQRLIEHLGIGSSVSLLGRRDDMPGVYASLNLLVCSSRAEGLPVALLEGMASGLPLVATAVGEVPRLVEDGVSGILVPPNDPNSLAQAIIDVLSDEELKTCLLQGARRKVRGEFSAERMTDEYLQVYSSVRPVSAAQQYVNQS
jgi:glycosyltransferase involved in cell wall biosynthesis